MRVGVLTVQVPFVRGGAELLSESLVGALREAGHEAEIVSLPFKWFPPDRLPPQILAARLMDVTASSGTAIDKVIGLKFPAYLAPHPDKVLWLLHQHRSAYDLWRQPLGDLHDQPGGALAMAAIRQADRRLLPEARRIFTISRRVSERLLDSCGIAAEPLLHPPPFAARFHRAEAEDFLLLPSRINAAKRQDLVVRALAAAATPARVVMIGHAEDTRYTARLETLARALPPGRLLIRGGVTDEEKVDLFARCRGVLYLPIDEDYGYVTLEAMLSGKPVITATDSGGAREFVTDGETGLVVAPEPDAVARAIDAVWSDPARALGWGEAGRAAYDAMGIGWEKVVSCLLG